MSHFTTELAHGRREQVQIEQGAGGGTKERVADIYDEAVYALQSWERDFMQESGVRTFLMCRRDTVVLNMIAMVCATLILNIARLVVALTHADVLNDLLVCSGGIYF